MYKPKEDFAELKNKFSGWTPVIMTAAALKQIASWRQELRL
jgi:hypothetical protein